MSVEGAFGGGEVRRSYTSDCCGPGKQASGNSASVRIKRRIGRWIEIGAEGGQALTDVQDMQWLMLVAAISPATRLAPWVQLGGGMVTQPGECHQINADPAPGPEEPSSFSPTCATAIKLGGAVAAGIRWRIGGRLAIGLEAAWVRGKTHIDQQFTTERLGLTVRLQ
jgi:hypothetical protein